MMGSEVSQLNGLEIADKPIEITDFWSHYHACLTDSCKYFSLKGDGSVSIFKGEAVLGPLWTITSPLEKCSNNLLKYRHPCILRYISAWQQRSILHLATENVQPLTQVLSAQSPLQICVGLNDVLRALVFLHEQVKISHNNVSMSAIYVTAEGLWKLGGFQYLCPFQELTKSYLKQARIHRYDKCVDPNEDTHEQTTKVDQYAFAVLVDDVFKGRNDGDVPHLAEFKKYCHDILQHPATSRRPDFSEVLLHSFFNHEFITMYKFLYFLPLKSEEEKCEFFAAVTDKLRKFDEVTVAKQLGGLLLSRLVMLDKTARHELIPFLFKPRIERSQCEEHKGLFSLNVFKDHIKPRLLQLFAVRDTQIRLLLLFHFDSFAQTFTHEELSKHVLPELLLGIKDVDDHLVSCTLQCLSELVPILGADAVIGGKRSKIFSDGRPNLANMQSSQHPSIPAMKSKSLKDFSCTEQVGDGNESFLDRFLIERPSPVGGECIDIEARPSLIELSSSVMPETEDYWSDWDTNRQNITSAESDKSPQINKANVSNIVNGGVNKQKLDQSRTVLLQKAAIEAKKKIRDISELDIKTQKDDPHKRVSGEEIDLFADMAPVIEKSMYTAVDSEENISNKLNFVPGPTDENSGWDEDWSE